jgi:hypothetical protein
VIWDPVFFKYARHAKNHATDLKNPLSHPMGTFQRPENDSGTVYSVSIVGAYAFSTSCFGAPQILRNLKKMTHHQKKNILENFGFVMNFTNQSSHFAAKMA